MRFYYTYKKQKVEFKPLRQGRVGIYNCGPTVYYYLTVGNLRAYVFTDLLRRLFDYRGYHVKQVMNLTDVGHLTATEAQKEASCLQDGDLELTDDEEGLDRMEKTARGEGITVWEVAQKYIQAILGRDWENREELGSDGDFGKLNIRKPHVICRATDHIQDQIKLIKRLEEKGYTYTTSQAVYFDITKFPRYEKLTGQSLSEMQVGKRADTSDPDRRHPADFRLWQLNQPDHAMQWESPWGMGFPGWHIECSAMSTKYLGQPFDIHTGGEDHIKLHHVNEMAQSESAYGRPMANYWLHNSFLTVDGGRMGKSLGNAYILKDVEERGFEPLDLRYFYLTAHYRTKQDFTWRALTAARVARTRLVNLVQAWCLAAKPSKIREEYKEKFVQFIEDDLALPQALALVWDLAKDTSVPDAEKLATILDFDRVLGLRLDEEPSKAALSPKDQERFEKAEELLKEREEARKAGNFAKADQIRDRIEKELGLKVEDGSGKSTVRKP